MNFSYSCRCLNIFNICCNFRYKIPYAFHVSGWICNTFAIVVFVINSFSLYFYIHYLANFSFCGIYSYKNVLSISFQALQFSSFMSKQFFFSSLKLLDCFLCFIFRFYRILHSYKKFK